MRLAVSEPQRETYNFTKVPTGGEHLFGLRVRFLELTSPASRTILGTDPRVTFHLDSSSNAGSGAAPPRSFSPPPGSAFPREAAPLSRCFLPPPPVTNTSGLLPPAKPAGTAVPPLSGCRPGDAGDSPFCPRLSLRGERFVIAPRTPPLALPPWGLLKTRSAEPLLDPVSTALPVGVGFGIGDFAAGRKELVE